jgi:hypothetical protein
MELLSRDSVALTPLIAPSAVSLGPPHFIVDRQTKTWLGHLPQDNP